MKKQILAFDMPGDVLKLHKSLETRLNTPRPIWRNVAGDEGETVRAREAKVNINIVHEDKLWS